MSRIRASLNNLVESTARIKPKELQAVLLSFSFVVTLMTSYSMLKPVRDAMSSNWTDSELSTLWTATFFVSLFAVWLYGAACSRIRTSRIVPGIYLLFAISFVVFYKVLDNTAEIGLAGKAFYVWISVFSLFHVSVFWTYMADTYSREQSLRLFAFIGSGSSIGAIAGPTMAIFLVGWVGEKNLLIISATLLIVPVVIVLRMNQLRNRGVVGNPEGNHNSQNTAIGGSSLAGFELFLKSRYLLGIGLFILLYVAINTFIYFELKNLMADVASADRVRFWAGIDLAVNVLSIVTAWFGTSRLTARFGLAKTLASVPAIIAIAMMFLALTPMLWVVVGMQILRRAGNYSITRPCREMLFTKLDRESRFKAKSVIDIAVYRGGDVMFAWIFTGLTQGLGLGLGAVALVGAAVAAVWAVVGLSLGKQFEASAPAGQGPSAPELQGSG
ncbi:MAG: MFS transporter [Pseudomonadales bacterium]